MELVVRQAGAVLVVGVRTATLDAHSINGHEHKLFSLIEDREAVVVDLEGVRYVDWFGFEMLLGAVARCPGKVRFGGVAPTLEGLFVLASLDRAVSLHPTLDAALARFRGEPAPVLQCEP